MRIAFAYGADAVYAGQPAFSLRGRENGFKTVTDLGDGIREAHSLHKKFYVASNLFPHNAKISAFQKALSEVIQQGPDAKLFKYGRRNSYNGALITVTNGLKTKE